MEKSVQALVVAVAISLLMVPSPPCAADAFTHPWGVFPQQRQSRILQHLNDAKTNDSFLDVEFEKVKRKEEETATKKVSSSQQLSSSSSTGSKSLLDLSLDMDPRWKEARIPFCYDDRYIDCHVAFTVDLDGTTTYGIGVPCDAAVAIVMEHSNNNNNKVITYMNPALEEHDELVQIMAAQLQELLGDDVFLKRTPKILTISGNLNKYITEQWQDDLFRETVSTQDLMDDSDEGLDFFYDFMKSQLGEREFQKTLEECRRQGDKNKDEPVNHQEQLLDLFNIPGLGNQQDDVDGLEKMLQELTSSKDISESESFAKLGEDLEHEGVALKLFGFHFREDGKSYSLVKLLKPFTIVGKYVDNADKDDLRFDLLTPQEEAIVIPRLEQICKADLEQSGLSLQ